MFAAGLGVGGLGRWVAYPLILWLTVFGGYLLGAAGRREREIPAEAV